METFGREKVEIGEEDKEALVDVCCRVEAAMESEDNGVGDVLALKH